MPKTYTAEVKAFTDFDLGYTAYSDNFKKNTDFIKEKRESSYRRNTDIWSLVSYLSGSSSIQKSVVVTGNITLIARIILNKLDIDVYNLVNEQFIYPQPSPLKDQMKKNSMISFSAPKKSSTLKNSTNLYKEDGKKVIIGTRKHDNLQTTTYTVMADNKLQIRILNSKKIDEYMIKHIRTLTRLNEITWVNAPVDMLYYDKEKTLFAGYTEKVVNTEKLLSKNILSARDVDSIPEKDLKATSLSDNIRLCYNVVRQVYFLKSFGFLVPDFSPENFISINKNTLKLLNVYNWGYNGVFCQDTSVVQATKPYNNTNMLDSMALCDEALYHFVFSVLTCGDMPFEKGSGNFSYLIPDYSQSFRKKLVPENIWNLFQQVFTENQDFSVDLLLAELDTALYNLEENPEHNMNYQQLISAARTETVAKEKDDSDVVILEEYPDLDDDAYDELLIYLTEI
ncbi:MAG: hypothetical protein IJD80_03455 [Oscillospiraceae bacterium]|nr:hypothetical protein [Oscillospiraceae bacterium]